MKQKIGLKRYWRPVKITAALIWMTAAFLCDSCTRQGNQGSVLLAEPAELAQPLETGENEELPEEGLSRPASETAVEQEQESFCYIHICGEVKAPGVYRMEEGSRVFQVVEKAGGFTDQAARGYLNMAQPVTDGMKLVVPGVDELKQDEIYGVEPDQNPDAGINPASAKVNINTATKDQLMVLRGIGESRAEDIIRYREEHGDFEKVEDIMKVSGIKEAAFSKIKDDITV